MLTANKLEKIIELEDNPTGRYRKKPDAKIADLVKEKDNRQVVIATRLATITDRSAKAGANQSVEQHNRREHPLEEIATQQVRLKVQHKDLAETIAANNLRQKSQGRPGRPLIFIEQEHSNVQSYHGGCERR